MEKSAPDPLEHPREDEIDLSKVLFALSDPARLELVRQLRDAPLEAARCHLQDPSLPKSTKSHQMKVLREAGVIRNEPKGRGRLLSLRREELDRRFPGLLDAILDASGGGTDSRELEAGWTPGSVTELGIGPKTGGR